VVRIRLVANCLADPSGIRFKGYEVDVAEEQAAVLVATGQWERVGGTPESREPAPAAPGPLREFRKRGRK